ncbi:SUMF1/EgtB/PvdO family nonheme iron enzyme [Thiothrix eikelboomii]|uniref:SUMF1/EgtB/PvdO family nonheme iron enzyme n=1 Tax=Thiothrix eikelboomii TaxID=92487 RepID=UPI003BAFE527
MPKIFISYARDQSHGENLAAEAQQQLQAAGFEVFRDVIGLKPGDKWYSKLEFELETSAAVVLIVSEKVRTSKWVHNEISMAEELGLPVIPVFAEKVRSPLWLRHLHALDFCVHCNWPALMAALPAVTVSAGSTAALKTATPSKPAWASASGKDQYGVYADLEFKGIVQRFRFIEAGTFWMGSLEDEEGRYDDEILHQVTLSQAFWLADTACTQAWWQAVMGNNPAYFKGDQNPVEQVSWEDAQSFIQKLKQQVSGLSLRLPTEAEWEYACRAGTRTPFSFGGTISEQQVNFGNHLGKAVSVKSYPANPWGLYEMHGNVWEWCEDGYADYPPQAVTDPRGAPASSYRVLRGGSWFNFGGDCRSAIRGRGTPDYRISHIGFRFALGHF